MWSVIDQKIKKGRHHFGKVPQKLNVTFSAESVRAVLTAISEDIGFGVVPKHLLVGDYKNLKLISTAKKSFENLLFRSLVAI